MDNLEKAQKVVKEKREAGEYRQPNPLEKAKNSTSLRDCINAHCYMCMGGELDDLATKSGITRLVQECQSEVCPLLKVRGWQ